MKLEIQYEKLLPLKIDCDVLVVGGSQSGASAAIACKRANPNAEVHLIEQFGSLGGQSVNCMVCHWEFREYTNNKGQVIAKGLGKEMIERIVKKDNSDPLYQEWLDGKGPPFEGKPDPRGYGDIPLNVEDIKLTLQEMCEEEGVKVHLFTKLLDIKTNQEAKIPSPDVAIVTGMFEEYGIKANIIIDCTANNDVVWKIGGKKAVYLPEEPVMPMQTYAWLGGVDMEKFLEAFWKHPEWWQMRYPDDKEQMFQHMREGKTIVIRGGAPYIDEADEKYEEVMEELSKYCTPMIYYWLKPVQINPIKIKDEQGNIIKTHYDSTWAIEGPSSFEKQYEQEKVENFMLDQLKAVHLMKKIHSALPGWENCYVERTATSMGFRKTRILKGLYEISGEDVKGGKEKDDVIGRASGHDVSRHNPEYEYGYDIPYRALIPKDIDGVIVGARSLSCDPHEKSLVGLNACRGISQTIIVSQAAGAAAGLCIQKGVEPREVDIKDLQKILKHQNVTLNPPDEK